MSPPHGTAPAGKLLAIGVSNFERTNIDNLFADGSFAPSVNQVLAHVGNAPFDLIDYSRSRHILVEAYFPIAHGAALKDERLVGMADRSNVSVA